MAEAVEQARAYIFKALFHGKEPVTGQGHGPLNHFHNPLKAIIDELDD
jgi:hydroxymethylpyrimidine/phosphomethylpyrimidine kinase